MDGEIVLLSEVPDPVFSQKMMGEGIAMIPTDGKVHAPVNGKVIQIAPTKHAVGMRADDGTEILIHVGLETVSLQGKGFEVKVSAGETVSVGDLLMEFDLAYIRTHAKSLVSPIVITNSRNRDQKYTLTKDKEGKMGETVIMTIKWSGVQLKNS